MHKPCIVRTRERAGNLDGHVEQLRDLESAVILHMAGEIPARTEFHRVIQPPAGFAKVVDPCDVRVEKPCNRPAFHQEALPDHRVCNIALGDDFHRYDGV